MSYLNRQLPRINCLSKPDNELYHAAFYFALHRFFSGEDFPLERLYETSPEMLFEQFYLYCQKHAEVLKDAKILQRNDPAAGTVSHAALRSFLCRRKRKVPAEQRVKPF